MHKASIRKDARIRFSAIPDPGKHRQHLRSHAMYSTSRLPPGLSMRHSFGMMRGWSKYQKHWQEVITSKVSSGKSTSSDARPQSKAAPPHQCPRR